MENMTPMLDAFSSGGGLLAAIVTYLITSVSLFAIARQDGEEFAWFAFVPILDLFLMCKIGDVNPLVLLLFFVPCVNIFVFAYLWARVGDTRDKAIWGWLTILPCFYVISPVVIALDNRS